MNKVFSSLAGKSTSSVKVWLFQMPDSEEVERIRKVGKYWVAGFKGEFDGSSSLSELKADLKHYGAKVWSETI